MKKVRFGVIGTNFITDWVIEGAKLDTRFELTAVYSRTQERANEFALKHQILHTFTSLTDMAKSPLIDAVYIASPNFLHCQQSILFMQNGKHVLCEKPLASNSKEVLDMIATSKKYGVTLMEAMKSTLAPSFKVLQSYVPKLGTIRRYFSSYCQYSSRYDKFKEGIVLNAFNPEYSNGAIMDIGVYTIYPMVVLFGRPKKIIANGIVLSSGADGQGTVVCEYDGFDATVIHSKIADSSLPSEIQGENGSLIMNRINKIEEVTWNPRKSSPEKLAEGMEKNEYYYEIEEFINLIENGKIQSEINTHQNSLMTIEIIDEVRRQLGVKYPADNFLE